MYIILGIADYQNIRTTEPPITRKDPDNDPVADFTMLGCKISENATLNNVERSYFFQGKRTDNGIFQGLETLREN